MKESNTLVGNVVKISHEGGIAKHQRAVHEGIKYPCGQCGKQFSRKGDVATHQKAIHEGVKYPCGQCDKEFSSKTSLARHQRNLQKVNKN